VICLLYSLIFSLAIHRNVDKESFLMGFNISALEVLSRVEYNVVMIFLILSSATKAYLVYRVIQILSKINLIQPFNQNMASLITNINYVALAIGIIEVMADSYLEFLSGSSMTRLPLKSFVENDNQFLFLAGIIFIISIVFKRGLEIQSDNNLTV